HKLMPKISKLMREADDKGLNEQQQQQYVFQNMPLPKTVAEQVHTMLPNMTYDELQNNDKPKEEVGLLDDDVWEEILGMYCESIDKDVYQHIIEQWENNFAK